MIYIDIEEYNKSVYGKSINTHNYEGSIHVDNLLVLDEPTNHLDTVAKEVLKTALKEYSGTILMVCHEPEFYEDIVTGTWDAGEWALKL